MLSMRRGNTMSQNTDRRTTRGRELANRLNRETVLARMPKLYYVEDFSMDRYRVGRTDWAGDVFECIPRAEFEAFKTIYERLNMPLLDLTNDDDGSEWDKVRQ